MIVYIPSHQSSVCTILLDKYLAYNYDTSILLLNCITEVNNFGITIFITYFTFLVWSYSSVAGPDTLSVCTTTPSADTRSSRSWADSRQPFRVLTKSARSLCSLVSVSVSRSACDALDVNLSKKMQSWVLIVNSASWNPDFRPLLVCYSVERVAKSEFTLRVKLCS